MRKRNKLFDSFAKAAAAMLMAGVLLTSCGGGGGEPEAPASPPAQEMPAPSQKPEEKPAESSSTASSVPASSSAASEAASSSEMASSSASSSESSEETESNSLWKYTVNSDGKTATLTGVSWYDEKLAGVVTLPRYVDGIKITAVADSAFMEQNIEELVIPEGIAKLGNQAFAFNRSLKKLTVQGKTDLGAGAFYHCDALETVNLNDNITEIPDRTFLECASLTTLKLPSKLERIGNSAFATSGLREIDFPDSVKEIGNGAFCSTALKKVILPKNLTEISIDVFNGCGNLTGVYIPKSVTAIGARAFLTMQGGALNDIYYAGSKTDWDKIKVDANGNEILKQAVVHYGAKAEEAEKSPVTAPKPVEETGWLFSGNAIVGYSDTAPALSGTVEFPAYYYMCGSGNYVYQVPITTIGDSMSYVSKALKNCTGVTAFVIPEGVTTIARGAFENLENLTSVSFPSTLRSIGERAFYGCKGIRQIQLPANLTSLGASAFENCTGVTTVVISEGATSIPRSAFANMENLTSVSLPSTLRSIGNGAFYGCKGIQQIQLPENLKTIGNSAFNGCTGIRQIQLPENLKTIGDRAFYGCEGIRQIQLPENLETIGASAFEATRITGVTLPASVKSIGSSAFACNSYLKTVNIQCNATMRENVFFNCKRLETVQLNDNILEIPENMFGSCGALQKIKLPKNLKEIADGAFYETGLTEIKIPESVTRIGELAFAHTWLKKVVLPQNVEKIGFKAFYYCYELEEIYIPAKVTYIDLSAFENCSDLTDIYYSGTKEQWEKIKIEEAGNEVLTKIQKEDRIHYKATPATMSVGI